MSNRRIKASLLSLPDELLSTIFSEVVRMHGSRTAAFASTCRRLAPIVRQEVYQELSLAGSKRQICLLSELCAKRADIRALVQVLHLHRTIEFNDDGEMRIDYTAEHPGNALLRSYFPALHTLSVLEATPVDIFNILNRVSATARPDIRRLTLGCVADPVLDSDDVHKEIWWHLLACLPTLELLTLLTTWYNRGSVRIVFDDARVFASLQNLHSLSLDSPWQPVGGPTLAALFPNLKRLRLNCESPAELEGFLRYAPTSVTQLVLWIRHIRPQSLQPDVLARFPLLERLCLRQVDATALLPSIRTSRIKSMRLSDGAQLTDQDPRSLVDGPTRMKYLKAVQVDYMTYESDPWFGWSLENALKRDKQHDLAQVKASLRPKWPQGCSADGLREVMDAARTNGIKVFGTALECLVWSDRLDEQIERLLVDNALASNDYTIIQRYLGEDSTGNAILRQRPRLAELIRKRRT